MIYCAHAESVSDRIAGTRCACVRIERRDVLAGRRSASRSASRHSNAGSGANGRRASSIPWRGAAGGRRRSSVAVLQALVKERPDRTTDELTRAYNVAWRPKARVHRSSILRALQRTGYVFKKNARGRRSTIVPVSKPSAPRSASGSRR